MKTKILISIVHFIKNSRHTNIAHKNKYICSTKIKKNKKKRYYVNNPTKHTNKVKRLNNIEVFKSHYRNKLTLQIYNHFQY